MSTTSGESPSDRAPTGGIHEGCRTRDVFVFIAGAAAGPRKIRRARLARERYRIAGRAVRQPKGRRDDAWFDGAISGGAFRRGRDTRCVIAQRPAHADHTFGRARHRSQGDRRDRGPHVDPHNDDVRRDQSEKARPHTGPNPVIWPIASKTRKF
jgi:hypothetical protein